MSERMAPAEDPVARLPEQWAEVMASLGEPPYRAGQVFHWIHARGQLDPAGMTNLPATLRRQLADDGLREPLRLEREHASADGARKLLLRLRDGGAIETVLLPASMAGRDADAAAGEDAPEPSTAEPASIEANAPAAEDHQADGAADRSSQQRVTQCVSTQLGCSLGCVFCASGVGGLQRHLDAAEIVGQVLVGRAGLGAGQTLSRVVFMGMGEPLHNYAATARTIRLLTHEQGLALSPRRITVSTAGLVPEMDQLAADFQGKIGLAVSLHAADDELRAKLMPVAQRYRLAELKAAMRRYPLGRGRLITIEYVLIAGRNDALCEADRLARLLRGVRVKINLIPANPIAGSPIRPSPRAQAQAFQERLRTAGYLCFIRRRRGDEVSAACGQLAGSSSVSLAAPALRPGPGTDSRS